MSAYPRLRKKGLLLLFLIAGQFLPVIYSAHAGARSERNVGFDLGVGQPFLTIIGGSASYNIEDDFRVSIGGGSFIYWATYEADFKIFLSPNSVAPYFGVGLAYMNGTPSEILIYTLNFSNAVVPFLEGGIDFTADKGEPGIHISFNLGVGVPRGTPVIMPGLSVGYYFGI